MKSIYLFILLAVCTSARSFSQVSATNIPDVLQLKELNFDFGKIPQGRPVTHNFQVTNKGKAPLLIENVEASCGCTTPEWSQDPIAPAGVSVIKVGFNASSEGKFQKSITIHYGSGLVKTVIITGEVYPMPTTSAPVNTSLSTLKQ